MRVRQCALPCFTLSPDPPPCLTLSAFSLRPDEILPMGLVMWIDLSLKPHLQPTQVGPQSHKILKIYVRASANKGCRHASILCVYIYMNISIYVCVYLDTCIIVLLYLVLAGAAASPADPKCLLPHPTGTHTYRSISTYIPFISDSASDLESL
jgi:hypothetical protein